MAQLYYLTAHEVVEGIRRREFTAEDCVAAVLERIHEVEGRIHAYVTILEEEAIRQAAPHIQKIFLHGCGFSLGSVSVDDGVVLVSQQGYLAASQAAHEHDLEWSGGGTHFAHDKFHGFAHHTVSPR